MASLRDEWSDTLVLIGQPAEETGAGAKAMLEDGLYERFPRPAYAFGLHVLPDLAAGRIGYRALSKCCLHSGFFLDSVSEERLRKYAARNQMPPGLHSARYYPDPSLTLETGVRSMTVVLLDILEK